jgi:hypothetical protein
MKPKVPDAPKPVLPREAPKRVGEGALIARDRATEREALARGLSSQYKTRPGGLTMPATLGQKKLFGE